MAGRIGLYIVSLLWCFMALYAYYNWGPDEIIIVLLAIIASATFHQADENSRK